MSRGNLDLCRCYVAINKQFFEALTIGKFLVLWGGGGGGGHIPALLRFSKIIKATTTVYTTTKLGGYILRPQILLLTYETRDDDVI